MKVRGTIERQKSWILTTIFLSLFLAGWWFATSGAKFEDRLLSPLILPSPMEVLYAFPQLHLQQGLLRSALLSFWRVTAGFTIASVLAITLGVCMASFASVKAFFKPLETVSAYVPIIVFIPLTLAWWGLTETQKIGFLSIACFVAMLPLILRAIESVSDAYLDVAKTKGASQWDLVRHVLVPVASADIWDCMRGIYGVGWGWIILAEVVNARSGLGYLMNQSQRRSNIAGVFAIIIVIVFIAALSDYLWQASGNMLFPYRKKK
ncbi:MAG: ABC transporter permease subunit [Candidatus Cloacimonetes bacterium]|nr:ABC transporter permease subunit [Candidatus Cloacimonadota bacterium]